MVVAAVIVPLYAAYALNSVDVGIQGKERLEQIIKEQYDNLLKASPEEQEELRKKLDGLEDMRGVIAIGERLQAANESEMPGLLRELDMKFEELKVHAGNKSVHVVITPDMVNNSAIKADATTQGFWLPRAYAASNLNDF